MKDFLTVSEVKFRMAMKYAGVAGVPISYARKLGFGVRFKGNKFYFYLVSQADADRVSQLNKPLIDYLII